MVAHTMWKWLPEPPSIRVSSALLARAEHSTDSGSVPMSEESHLPSFFISFASRDVDVATELTRRLDALGVTTFFAPRDIGAGENFALRIVQAIVESSIVIVLLSDAAANSPHVRREVSLAIDERRRLIPLTLPGTRFPQDFAAEWSYWLSAVQVVPFTSMDAVVELLAPRLIDDRATVTSPPAFTRDTAPERVTSVSPVSLLRPEHAVVPLAGREDDLARLAAWLVRPDRLSVRVVTGPGGQGKSRLARELIGTASSRGWNASFLRDLEAPTGSAAESRLLVVDYAETKGPELVALLTRLVAAAPTAAVRVLLLARAAGDWWRKLASANPEIEDLLADATVQQLAPLTSDTATDLYFQAVRSFALALGVEVPAVKPPTDFGESIVDLLQRALLGVLAGTNAESSGSEGVVRRLLAHERRYVRNAAVAAGLRDFDDTDFDRVVALYSLFPPADETQAAELAGIGLAGLDPQRDLRVARLLRRVYPAVGRYSSGLKPDVVAELAVAGLLEEDGGIPGGPATWRAADDDRYQSGLRLLSRASATSAAAQAELDTVIGAAGVARLPSAFRVAVQVEAPHTIASAISSALTDGRFDDDLAGAFAALPDETVALSDVAAELAQRLISHVARPGAPLLLEASNRFSDAGWGGPALTAVSAGIAELRDDPSPSSRPELGRALSNLSNRMWETGSLDEAIPPAAEAVVILSDLDEFALIGARNNLAFRLIEAGRYDEARAQLDLALVSIGDAGGATGPMRPRALSVENNVLCLDSANGAWDAAAEQASRLVEQRRADYAVQRDRNLAYLARALTNAAVPFARNGELSRAQIAIAEARSLHRLTAQRAPIFAFEAAESALIDAIVRSESGHGADSSEPIAEARGTLAGIRDDLPGLADRLGRAIDAAEDALCDGPPLQAAELTAIGSSEPGRVSFPLLLEYKDL